MIQTKKIKKTGEHFKRRITKEQINTFLEHVKANYNYKFYLLFKIMCFMGLRLVEALHINVDTDISTDYRYLKVCIAKSYNLIERQIPKELAEELDDYVNCNPDEVINGFLFASKSYHNYGQPMRCQTIINMFAKIRKELAVVDPSFKERVYYGDWQRKGETLPKYVYNFSTHAFRAYYISQLYKASDFDLVFTQKTIGHKDIKTTASYVRLANTQKENQLGSKIYNETLTFG